MFKLLKGVLGGQVFNWNVIYVGLMRFKANVNKLKRINN